MSSERTQEEGGPGQLALSYKFRPMVQCAVSSNPPGSDPCPLQPSLQLLPRLHFLTKSAPCTSASGREGRQEGRKEGGKETHTHPPSSRSINEWTNSRPTSFLLRSRLSSNVVSSDTISLPLSWQRDSPLLHSLPCPLPPISSWPVSPPYITASALRAAVGLSCQNTALQGGTQVQGRLGPQLPGSAVHWGSECFTWEGYKASSPAPSGPWHHLHLQLQDMPGRSLPKSNDKLHFAELRVYHELLTGYLI